MITAVMAPMNSESGFLKTRHETESGDTSAGSLIGFEKSIGGRSPGSSSARIAASRLLRKGQGKMIGALTATNTVRRTGVPEWRTFGLALVLTGGPRRRQRPKRRLRA